MSAKKKEDKDGPYQQILSRLAQLEHKVESIDETNAFALRATASAHQQSIREIFKHGKRRAQVYLAADGTRGVVEIADHLDMKQPHVSRQLKFLKNEGLLELMDRPGRQDFWTKKAIDRTVRITQYLCAMYNLLPNGRLNKTKKKKKKNK
jgi:DNA-binding transcriptional ArsR family regulator